MQGCQSPNGLKGQLPCYSVISVIENHMCEVSQLAQLSLPIHRMKARQFTERIETPEGGWKETT